MIPLNEPIKYYPNNSDEYLSLQSLVNKYLAQPTNVYSIIDGKEVLSSIHKQQFCPHNLSKLIVSYDWIDSTSIANAIEVALQAKHSWANKTQQERNLIFEKAADLAATKYHLHLNATTIVGQSKNSYQAEIDAVCEWVDFLRFNNSFATQIQTIQPTSTEHANNHIEYRPLEGFVVAITPFNFTAIAANLACAPALMGNVVLWKPSDDQLLSAQLIMQILMEAGLPNGVINLIVADGETFSNTTLHHPYFAGLHFTGSTHTFELLNNIIHTNQHLYINIPRVVGETGGKDFIFAHYNCNIEALATAIIRGAFEYQGQKCSAASRVYLPNSIALEVIGLCTKWCNEMRIGDPSFYNTFMGAVINEKSFKRLSKILDELKKDEHAEIIYGGNYDCSSGYFIEPTIVVSDNPEHTIFKEEFFGPIVGIHIYQDMVWPEILKTIDKTSTYALTGSIFSNEETVIEIAKKALQYTAGNIYINDKPTGAVVNQQPFGGARKSGTNDKAGSVFNLMRWVQPLSIKTHITAITHPWYPYMKD
jgi:1-pyrroline-5-carboxylate dehydrogenase